MYIQRIKVLKALRWLKVINLFYTNIVINLDLLNTWKDKFVSVSIASYILQYKPDIRKQQGYSIDLEIVNLENELYHTVNATSPNDLWYLSNCLYTNANNTQEPLTTKLISVLANHKDLEIPINLISKAQILMYQNKSYVKSFND